MHHLNCTSPAALLIPGILGREEGGRHSQNKLKGNSSPLWFVGLWCILASEMLLIHEIYIGSRGTREIHISKKSLYLLGNIRYNATSSSRSFLSYVTGEKEGSKRQVSLISLVLIFEHQLLFMTIFSNSEHLQIL